MDLRRVRSVWATARDRAYTRFPIAQAKGRLAELAADVLGLAEAREEVRLHVERGDRELGEQGRALHVGGAVETRRRGGRAATARRSGSLRAAAARRPSCAARSRCPAAICAAKRGSLRQSRTASALAAGDDRAADAGARRQPDADDLPRARRPRPTGRRARRSSRRSARSRTAAASKTPAAVRTIASIRLRGASGCSTRQGERATARRSRPARRAPGRTPDRGDAALGHHLEPRPDRLARARARRPGQMSDSFVGSA